MASKDETEGGSSDKEIAVSESPQASENPKTSKYAQHFADEFKMIQDEVTEMEGLFAKIMGQVNDASPGSNRRGGGASPLTFISNMMENAISAKSSKISLIKEMVRIKKEVAVLDMKADLGGEDEERFKGIAKEFHKLMSKQAKEAKESGLVFDEEEEEILEMDEIELVQIAEGAYEKQTGRKFETVVKIDDVRERKKKEKEEELEGLDICIDEMTGVVYFTNENDEIVGEEDEMGDYDIDWRAGKVITAYHKVLMKSITIIDTLGDEAEN